MSTTIYPRTSLDVYRLFGLTDKRSLRARAEEALELVLGASPDLAPGGWCDDFTTVGEVLRFRREPGVRLRPHLVEAFAWARIFVSLGCRGVAPQGWNGTPASRLARLAEDASESALRRRLTVDWGVICAAALSLGITVRRHTKGPDAQVAVYSTWEDRR